MTRDVRIVTRAESLFLQTPHDEHVTRSIGAQTFESLFPLVQIDGEVAFLV